MNGGSGAAQPVGSLDLALAHALELLDQHPSLALEQATEILNSVPAHPIATLLVGMAQRRLGDTSAALALCDNDIPLAEMLLRAHLREHPTDVAAIRMLAEVAARLGRYADAEGLLARCLELAPGFVEARAHYATVLNRQNRPTEALAQVDQLLAVEPDNPNH